MNAVRIRCQPRVICSAHRQVWSIRSLVCRALLLSRAATFRYRVLHVAARISRSARQTRLRIDQTWRWATQISHAWYRIRAAFT